MSQTVKVQIYLPDGSKAKLINVTKDNTIREILYNIDFTSELDYVVFTAKPHEKDMHTPIVNLEYSMEQLNMWHLDKDYIAEFSLYNKSDTEKYNHERLSLYTNTPSTTDLENPQPN